MSLERPPFDRPIACAHRRSRRGLVLLRSLAFNDALVVSVLSQIAFETGSVNPLHGLETSTGRVSLLRTIKPPMWFFANSCFLPRKALRLA